MKKTKQKMSEEEKKRKFGDKYDPNYKPMRKPKSETSQNRNVDKPAPIKQDWEWYALSEEIAQQLGNFSYSDLTGIQVTGEVTSVVTSATTATTTVTTPRWTAQNVMRIGYVNAQLAEASSTSALNKAATQLYVFLRHVNSGARNYEPADLIMVILAMRDIYREFFELKRAIGTAKYFNYFNRSVPETLVQAMRIDFNDLVKNIALYTGQLNVLANSINAVAIPKYFKAFERAALVSSIIFSDSDSMRGQFYLYDADGYYTFSGTTSTRGSQLTYANKSVTTETFATRLNRLSGMLSAILDDTDANTISGDILHAFKDSEVYVLTQIPSDYMVVPKFNEDLLAQVENAFSLSGCGVSLTASGGIISGSMNVTQINGKLLWAPSFQSTASGTYRTISKFLFNSHKDEVSYKDNLEWSRLIGVVSLTGDASAHQRVATVTACGLELVTTLKMFKYSGTSISNSEITQIITNTASNVVTMLAQIGQYDWHPTVYVVADNDPAYIDTLADVKKYVWLEADLISKIHDAANNASFTSLDLYSLKR